MIRCMAKYFGTNGVRGKFDELTPQHTMALAQAIGTYLCEYYRKAGKQQNKSNKCTIVVARDCRITGEILANAAIAGLASIGCDVLDIGIASSPTAEFMIKKLQDEHGNGGCAGCIIVSASHNPPEWNALKVVDYNGVSVSQERGEEIERLLGKTKLARWNETGRITKCDTATLDHISAIKKLVNQNKIASKKPKVIIDCGNGTASLIAPKLLKELGAEIMSINSHPDGTFPGRPSEPTEVNVKELISTVKESKADAGIAWDGDGDRVIFVDEKGNYVIGDKVYALSLMWKLAEQREMQGSKQENRYGKEAITTAATSKIIEDVAKQFGCAVKYTAIGAPYLSEEIAKGKAVMAGEEVGGVIWPELSLAKDGFLTAAKLLEAVCNKPISKWLESVPKYYNVKYKIDADNKTKKSIVNRVAMYAKKRKLRATTVDGVRIDLPESWVIVRASGTENYVRVFAEARSENEAKTLADEYLKIAKGKP